MADFLWCVVRFDSPSDGDVDRLSSFYTDPVSLLNEFLDDFRSEPDSLFILGKYVSDVFDDLEYDCE